MKRILNLLILFLLTNFFFSQNTGSLSFIKNNGQWASDIQFKTNTIGGKLYFKSNELIQVMIDVEEIHEITHHDSSKNKNEQIMECYAYKMEFLNSNTLNFQGKNKKTAFHNYFIGNDESKWQSNVPLFSEIYSSDLYPNIDYKVYSRKRSIKYDFIVKPGGDPKKIKLKYKGLKAIQLIDGDLQLLTSLGKVVELKPYCYQIINGLKIEVASSYVLKGETVSYKLGDYDKTKNLIIDPEVIASTYSGSTENIYGHTSTYSENGDIYVAGGGFDPGLPVTTGAFQVTYGGIRDMCINKYNSDGTSLIYSTYLGGSKVDIPHSMVEHNNSLYVLGSTFSNDFPTSSSGYDLSYNGEADITVTKFNQNGTGIIGSTYLGGSEDDGINNTLVLNSYGDAFRGEIITDEMGNCYVASFSKSSDFPTSTGAYQTTFGGKQDGVVIKLNSNLSALDFSTYLGGSEDDGSFSLRVVNSKTYVCGIAGNSFFNETTIYGNNGGHDGYVISLDANGKNIIEGSYIGTTLNDNSMLIENNDAGEIYVLGKTEGIIKSSAGAYDYGDGVYISKFSSDLSKKIFTSTLNSGSPVAFLVDHCDLIYASFHGIDSVRSEITGNAVQKNLGGFYLVSLSPDASQLNFGSFYGGRGSHVDGGTSRFDKRGIIYQATCTSFGFPTTSDAYSATNASGSYDMTVFKIDFEQQNVTISLKDVPNVFSPNGDGVNDVFRIKASVTGCGKEQLLVKIYNRWGQLMFESNDINFEWDGKTTQGEKANDGVYFVVIEVDNDKTKAFKTSLTLFGS